MIQVLKSLSCQCRMALLLPPFDLTKESTLMNSKDKATMSVSSNGSAVRPQAPGEIDLYDELVTFTELSPHEKQRYLDQFELNGKATTTDLGQPIGSLVEQFDVEAAECASKWCFQVDDRMNESLGAQRVDEFSVAAFEDMNLQFAFKDAIVGPACGACGAQSDADDLFCMSCGAFLNGVDSQTGDPSCGDCSRDINLDEIFCPWCGSTLSAM